MTDTQSNIRRLAAILAADIAGYSRLMGADEEGTAGRLNAVRAEVVDPAIAANHGRIVKTTGDGMLAEFGSAVDAMRAALAIQGAMAARNAPEPVAHRIAYRIGIHIGDVLVQSDGDLLGDGVNIAARLEGIAEPGGICLSEDAVHQVQGKVEASFADAGMQRLKNIAQPVRVFTATPGLSSRGSRLNTERRRSPLLRIAIFVIGLMVAIGLVRVGVSYFRSELRPQPAATASVPVKEAPRYSIVVLPFANLSGDAAQDYVADGITENLTTDLTRLRDLFVIARNTAFTYKGKSVDAKDIGKELNVRYVLEGSVQRSGDRVRVNAQLIDTNSGAHIWADRFDEGRGDLFKLQDEIVGRLVNTLGYELTKAEQLRSSVSHNPDAVDLYLRALAVYNQSRAGSDKAKVQEARVLIDESLKLDPNNPEVLMQAAWLDFSDVAYSNDDPAQHERERAEKYVARAIALDPDYSNPYVLRAMIDMVTRRTDEALEAAAKAIALSPSEPNGYGALAWAQTMVGKDNESLANLDRAMSLSPRDPSTGFWYYLKGGALFDLGRYDEAIAAENRAIDLHFAAWPANVTIAAAYAMKGDLEKARVAVADARNGKPDLTIAGLKKTLELPDLYWDALRKAGLPEG